MGVVETGELSVSTSADYYNSSSTLNIGSLNGNVAARGLAAVGVEDHAGIGEPSAPPRLHRGASACGERRGGDDEDERGRGAQFICARTARYDSGLA